MLDQLFFVALLCLPCNFGLGPEIGLVELLLLLKAVLFILESRNLRFEDAFLILGLPRKLSLGVANRRQFVVGVGELGREVFDALLKLLGLHFLGGKSGVHLLAILLLSLMETIEVLLGSLGQVLEGFGLGLGNM